MKRIGKDISAAEYWSEENAGYAARIDNAYHAHRLTMIRSLIDPIASEGVVLDFGCGDGVMLLDFEESRRIGIDPDLDLLNRAKERVPDATFVHGGVNAMKEVEAGSVDLILCLNVAAYFSDEEDQEFYMQVGRVLKRGGALVITHSNELFDLFTLNAFTANFFKNQFGVDASSLLTHPDKPDRITYNVRENPLHYLHKLAAHGLREERQGFSNQHARPPLLDSGFSLETKDYTDTTAVAEEDRWKLLFTCSTFGSRAVKTGSGY